MRNTLTIPSVINDAFRDMDQLMSGIPQLHQIRQLQSSGFPPYDLIKINETTFRLEMAVAGYSYEDIEITQQNNVLIIEGKTKNDDNRVFLHKGIASRKFIKKFDLDQYVNAISSTLENGILSIEFEKQIPEAMKPRVIKIETLKQIGSE